MLGGNPAAPLRNERTVATQPKPYLTPDEHLAFARGADVKHEYYYEKVAFAPVTGRPS